MPENNKLKAIHQKQEWEFPMQTLFYPFRVFRCQVEIEKVENEGQQASPVSKFHLPESSFFIFQGQWLFAELGVSFARDFFFSSQFFISHLDFIFCHLFHVVEPCLSPIWRGWRRWMKEQNVREPSNEKNSMKVANRSSRSFLLELSG